MKRINLYLPEELIERLHALAQEKGTTFSSLTRELLEGYAFMQSNPAARAREQQEFQEEFSRMEKMLEDQAGQFKDIRAVLDLILHFAKRSAEK